MDIRKRLIVNNATEVNAVLLNDEGEEYPVFLDSLHNNIIFPTLMESGYKLVNLPYGFVKNGQYFDDLPLERIQVSPDQEELMYNSIGAKLSFDELKSHIDTSIEGSGIKLPPTNYTITTREKFLKYLDLVSKVNDDNDFMPINYFVSPEARFNYQEYLHDDNAKYVAIMDARRTMTLKKFQNLFNWLKQFGLRDDATPMDVISGYFAWGFDGLNYTIINISKEMKTVRITGRLEEQVKNIIRTHGFITSGGDLLVPIKERSRKWNLSSNDPSYVANVTSMLAPGDTAVCEFQSNDMNPVTTYTGTIFNLKFDCDVFVFQGRSYPTLRVKSPISSSETIPLSMAIPSNSEALFEHCALKALAREIYNRRKPTTHVSSYEALLASGATPMSALEYISSALGLTTNFQFESHRAASEDSMPDISYAAIEAFVKGNKEDTLVNNFLQDIVDGLVNIDSIAKGREIESGTGTQNIYNELYAVHNVFGISLQDIYDKIRMAPDDEKKLVFSNGQVQHSIDISPMRYSLNGYMSDIAHYDIRKSRECSCFMHVLNVAREVGEENADKHVGVELAVVYKSNKQVKEILSDLENKIADRINTMLAGPGQEKRKQQLTLRIQHMAMTRFFEIAFKGTMTWPTDLGGTIETMPYDLVSKCYNQIYHRVELLPTLCDYQIDTSGSSIKFGGFCTNAYLTPQYVIPRGDSPIHEISFMAAWVDWKNSNPNVFAQLVDRGVFKENFVSWYECVTNGESFRKHIDIEDDIDNPRTLEYYYRHVLDELNSYPSNQEFTACTHPFDYLWPGVAEQKEAVILPASRSTNLVPMRTGAVREITKKDYFEKLLPSKPYEEPDQFLREFTGFSVDALFTVKDIFNKLPVDKKNFITVITANNTLYLSDKEEAIDFRRITELDFNEYPITHLCNRTYLLRATDGRIWEVQI